jgi:hypothetical protein
MSLVVALSMEQLFVEEEVTSSEGSGDDVSPGMLLPYDAFGQSFHRSTTTPHSGGSGYTEPITATRRWRRGACACGFQAHTMTLVIARRVRYTETSLDVGSPERGPKGGEAT